MVFNSLPYWHDLLRCMVDPKKWHLFNLWTINFFGTFLVIFKKSACAFGKRNNRKIVLLGFDYAEKNITQLYNRLHTAVQGELQANMFAVFSFLLRNETVSR